MCPNCPRCNAGKFGCQDRFGNNMRPCGGILGAMPAFGGATEHQGHGTPHFHAEGHIASAYRFGTLQDVVKQLQTGLFSFQDIVNYQEWLHAEDLFDESVREEVMTNLENDWHQRFSAPTHDDKSQAMWWTKHRPATKTMFAILSARISSTHCNRTVRISKSSILQMCNGCSVACSITCTNARRRVFCLSKAVCARHGRAAQPHAKQTSPKRNFVWPNPPWCVAALPGNTS